MESKIIMYDASGTEVGETYSRRARQLVKQQRAVWADDTHTAIRFAPDAADEWEPTPPPAPTPVRATLPRTPKTSKTAELYALAEKRVHDRRRIMWHTISLIPVLIIIFVWGMVTYNNSRSNGFFLFTMGLGWGVWITAYIAHLRNYVKMSGYIPLSGNWESRRKMALDIEVERLRRMGYSE